MLRRFNDQDPQPTNGEDQPQTSPTSQTDNRSPTELANTTGNGQMLENERTTSAEGTNLPTITVLTLILKHTFNCVLELCCIIFVFKIN